MRKIPALILAGGLGTRLRAVDAERPKPMVVVEGKPFLYWLLFHLKNAGFDEFILSVGYKAEAIASYDWAGDFPFCKFEFVTEEKPLGTGGAVQMVFKSFSQIRSAWVFNGDTLLENILSPALLPPQDEVHYVCLPQSEVFDATPNLKIQGDRVIGFGEGGNLFDAGQVFVSRKAVEAYGGEIPASLHKLVEASFHKKAVGFTVVRGHCYDIGTPQRLERFCQFVRQNNGVGKG